MKIALIILAILVLLGIVIFLLIRKPEKVIDDDAIVKPGADYDIDKNYCENHESDKVENEEEVNEIKIPDDDAIVKPGADYDIDKHQFSEETHKSGDSENTCLQEGIDYTKEPEKVVEETEEEVYIPEHCKPQEDPVDTLPNKYFFNIHKYTTARNRSIYCVVCNAVIKGHNYRIVVRNSFYPYIGSYTKNLCAKIASKYTDTITVEEFLKTGSTKFDRVGKIVDALPYIY